MVKPEDKNATPFIQDYKEYHTGGWRQQMGRGWSRAAAAVAGRGCLDSTCLAGLLLVDSVQHWLSTSPPPCSRQTCRSSSASR